MAAGDVFLEAAQSVAANVLMGDSASSVAAPVYVTTTTATALASGGARIKLVAAIEGYGKLLTDADIQAAVDAHSGRDWTSALGGLFVELDAAQTLNPWNPFMKGGGKCVLKVQPDASDTLGIDLNRGAYGAEAKLQFPMGRDGSYGWRKVNSTGYSPSQFIYVDNGTAFTANSDIHIGTECVGIGTVGANQLQILQRGKYSPFGTAGAGGDRYAEYHRIMADPHGVMLNPVMSQYPRTWKGRLVGVWMHVEQDGVLNSRDNAQLVFAGRIASTSDDPNTGFAVIECEPLIDSIGETMVGRDMYSGIVQKGVFLTTGQIFRLRDENASGNARQADDLVVVSGGAVGANQINSDYYSLQEVCDFLNAWLVTEVFAGRIFGAYTWRSPVTSGQAGMRTKCYWTSTARWRLTMPGMVFDFLGLGAESDPSMTGAASTSACGADGNVSDVNVFEGQSPPWEIVVFHQIGVGSYNWQMNITSQRGTLIDQYDLLPLCDKPPDRALGGSTDLKWGYFLVDDQYLILASFLQSGAVTTFSHCIPAKYGLQGVKNGLGVLKLGRHAGNDTGGPVSVKQILILSGSEAYITKCFYYSSGTAGYNHQTVTRSGIGVTVIQYDILGYGVGLGIPGSLLSTEFERSANNVPGAQTEVVVVIDEPIKFSRLFEVDYVARWCFPRWKNGHVLLGRWQIPNADIAIAQLTESNKQEPVGQVNGDGQRASSSLTDQWQVSQIKIDYNRDLTLGSGGKYQNSVTFEDSTAVDDAGGVAEPKTLEARNTFHDYLQTGQGIEALMPKFYDMWSLFSRPLRLVTRSIAMENWISLAVGDVVTVNDLFMRDPATGIRGVSTFPAIIVRHSWNPGGPVAGRPGGEPASAHGEVDLAFLDLHRYGQYAPSALVDSTASNGGWNATTLTFTTVAHEYSFSTEANDASRFAGGDQIFIQQLDPDSTGLSWKAAVLSTTPTSITIDRDLAGWDSTKLYTITYGVYADTTNGQHANIFQGSSTTGLVQNQRALYEFTSTTENLDVAVNPTAYGEFVGSASYGDGSALDVASEASLIRTLNAYHDYKSAHQAPTLQLGGAAIQLVSALAGARAMMYCAPIYLGADTPSNSVYRLLYIQPVFALDNGLATSATLWVTITRSPPTWSTTPTVQLPTIQFNDYYQTFSWTSSSVSTVVTGAVQGFQTGIKNNDGWAWLIVEGSPQTDFYGFAKCSEGPRVTQ